MFYPPWPITPNVHQVMCLNLGNGGPFGGRLPECHANLRATWSPHPDAVSDQCSRCRMEPPFKIASVALWLWLNSMVYGRYNELVFMWFINQHSHHWGAPSCSDLILMFPPKWTLHNHGMVRARGPDHPRVEPHLGHQACWTPARLNVGLLYHRLVLPSLALPCLCCLVATGYMVKKLRGWISWLCIDLNP